MARKKISSCAYTLIDAVCPCVESLGNELIWNARHMDAVDPCKMDAEQLAVDCKRLMFQLMFFGILDAEYAAGDEQDSDRHVREMGAAAIGILRKAAADPEWRTATCLEYQLYDRFRIATMGLPGLENVTLVHPHSESMVSQGSIRNTVLLEAADAMGLLDDPVACRFPYAEYGIELLSRASELLLTFRGRILHEEMYAVKCAKDKITPEHAAYFVPRSKLDEYAEDERVLDSNGNLCSFRARTFLYRSNSRKRDKLASFYTPQELRECLVKFALKDNVVEGEMPADEILNLTIMEPSVGAGAFLVETVNQLSAAYLEKKQKELGITIPEDKYPYELARVKKHITSRNAYGVDLDDFAVEVAHAALFLNALERKPTHQLA